jgi:Spy/CpxP family protein refolding chaperone
MLGFLLGTVCLIGLFKVARAHRYGYGGGFGGRCGGYGGGWGGYGGGHGGGYGGEDGPRGWRGGGFRSRGFGPRFFLRAIFERLDTTPGQEKVILQATDELKAAFGGAKEKLRDTRQDFARVFRGELVDEAALSDIFVKHDTVISETRRSAVEAVRKAHEALTEEQRAKVADFIERGRGGWGRGGPRHWM